MSKLILTDEAIFHTIQGEGEYAGTPCTFVRLSGCNLRCTWLNKDGTETICDTPYSSFKPDRNVWDIDTILEEVEKGGHEHVVISGGEPFIQKELPILVDKLFHAGKKVTIETNGTIYTKVNSSLISISPKLSTSANGKFKELQSKKRLNIESLSRFVLHHAFQLKFVVNTEDDVNEIKEYVDQIVEHAFSLAPVEAHADKDVLRQFINERIWLMPQGVTSEQLNDRASWVWETAEKNNWHYTDRLHIRIFGQKRGV